jgi:hypothetical protein
MKFMELPKHDEPDRKIRIRPDRVDVVDEVIEEYETAGSIAIRQDIHEANNATLAAVPPNMRGVAARQAGQAPTLQEMPEPVLMNRTVTVIYVQGRRNPWRVSTPAHEVTEMLHTWSQTGRLQEDEDDDGWSQ